MIYYDLGQGGRGWCRTAWARHDMGADAYICCPGPSLVDVPRGRGRKIFAVNTAYPRVKPDIWMGLDRVECYDRRIWAEPFVKVCRGNYGDMALGDKPIKFFDNVFFATIRAPGAGKTLFDYLNQEDPLVWHKNTLASMLHLVIKMGARVIYLVGCDMGGDKDYYDDRVLTDDKREYNRRLYREQVGFIKDISFMAFRRGIEVISATPGSPLNEFLPYKKLDEAIEESERKVDIDAGALVHCIDAEGIDVRERALYEAIWKKSYSSPRSLGILPRIQQYLSPGDRVLEIGSGDGTTMMQLRNEGVDVTGTDIYATRRDVIECPAWRLPFNDGEFEVSFSTDVLEHIPTEKVGDVIKELLRVTKRKTIHFVSCQPAQWDYKVMGEKVHKTVKPIDWWVEQFSSEIAVIADAEKEFAHV